METLENKYGTVNALATGGTNILKISFNGFVPETQFKVLWEHYGKCVARGGWNGFLVDGQQIRVVAPETQKWLVHEWSLGVVKTQGCGSKVAVVDATDFFGRLVIKQLVQKLSGLIEKVPIQVFKSEQEALYWVEDQTITLPHDE